MAVEQARRSLAALEHCPGAFAAISVHRPRSAADAWSMLEALAGAELARGVRVLVGVGRDIARVWLDEPGLEAPRTLPRALNGYRLPSTQGGLLVQLSAEERAPVTAALRALDALLAPFCWKDEEITGGWDADRREPLGFRERATSTPDAAAAVTIQSGPGAGGAWLLYLRFEAERARFLRRSLHDREQIVGATLDGVRIPNAPEGSHVGAVHRYAPRLLRRGFPYRSAGSEGLAFVAAARSPEVFDEALDAMLGASGPVDRLLAYAPALSGGVYFASPSLSARER